MNARKPSSLGLLREDPKLKRLIADVACIPPGVEAIRLRTETRRDVDELRRVFVTRVIEKWRPVLVLNWRDLGGRAALAGTARLLDLTGGEQNRRRDFFRVSIDRFDERAHFVGSVNVANGVYVVITASKDVQGVTKGTLGFAAHVLHVVRCPPVEFSIAFLFCTVGL
jgi:hypothetical protein